jgi:hypothetical protein
MEREHAQPSLHRRLMSLLARSAQAQEESRSILARHAEVDEEVFATMKATRSARAHRARARAVRIRTGR